MTVTLAELRDWSRAHPEFLAVRLADWQALDGDQRARLRQGLADRGLKVGTPARWTLAGPVGEDDDPDASDVLLVSADHRLSERVALSIAAAVARPDLWDPGRTVDPETGEVTYTVSNRDIAGAVAGMVDAEMNARHPNRSLPARSTTGPVAQHDAPTLR